MADTRYIIGATSIGEGGFGKVHKGRDATLERDVAIKTLDPIWGKADDAEKERFRREARILARLSHPNIPAIYDVVFKDDEFRIIFQFIAGNTVRELLQQSKTIGLVPVRTWFDQLASALEHAHESKIIHRDIKPENMVVTSDSRHCYLIDFGIALSLSEQHRLTGGGVIGTPGYMSPEHERGEDVDESDDVYVLGVCLYEALSGRRVSLGNYEELSVMNEAVPPQVDDLVNACIATKGARIRSATEFHRQLSAAFHIGAQLSSILAEGQLHQIIEAIRYMTPEDFMSLPAGQRLLIVEKAKDLIDSGERVQFARMEFLTVLPTLAMYIDADEYGEIVTAALMDGFEHESRTGYVGNRHIRSSLEEAAKRVASQNHHVIVDSIQTWIERNTIDGRESWFYHMLRGLITKLMANVSCSNQDATSLATLFKQVNRLQRQHPGDKENPEVLLSRPHR